MFPISIILVTPYILFWGYEKFSDGMGTIINLYLIIIAGIVLHEILHLSGWILFTSKGFLSFRIGLKFKYMTPYCHCKEPLKVKHYATGVALPLVILGIIPSLFGILTGNGTIFGFGIIFSVGAGGDIIILFRLLRLNPDLYIIDLPDKIGFKIQSSS